MTDEARDAILESYADGRISVREAAASLGGGVSISEVILWTAQRFGRLPDRQDDFTRSEHRRALKLLGLDGASSRTG